MLDLPRLLFFQNKNSYSASQGRDALPRRARQAQKPGRAARKPS